MTDKPTQTDAATPECLTCSDHGAVGNILTAEPCPDCTRWNVQPAPATQHARITELESQLAQRFDAADMATVSAQGFRDGVASVSAGWQSIETAPKEGQAILVTDGMDCYCVEWDEEFDWWTVDDNKLGPFRLRGSAPTHWMQLPPAPGPADGESNG